MSLVSEFEARLPTPLKEKFRSLTSPIEVQRYLDSLPYIGEERDRCPLDVMKDGQCHCLDGGLLAALTLRRTGEAGILIDLVPGKDSQGRNLDDDHVLALFRSSSNFRLSCTLASVTAYCRISLCPTSAFTWFLYP